MSDQQSSENQSVISYDSPWKVYSIDWCNYGKQNDCQRLLLSSYKEDYSNVIQVELWFHCDRRYSISMSEVEQSPKLKKSVLPILQPK